MNIEISDVTRRFSCSPAVAGELTALATVPVRHRTPRTASAVPLNAARLLRVELFAHAFVGAAGGSGSPVQRAVQAALLRGAGIPFAAQPGLIAATENFPEAGPGPATGPVYAAARRLATRPAAVRHAWLAAHLAALRAGRLTLKDLP